VIFVSVGLPGRFAEWCDAVIVRLAESLGGMVAVAACSPLNELLAAQPRGSALEQIGTTLIGACQTHLVIAARQPEERLVKVLTETGKRFVVAVEDPRAAVADIAARADFELAAATRMVVNGCSALMPCVAAPGALALHASEVDGDRCGTVLAIAEHLQIPIGTTEAAAIVADLDASGLSPRYPAFGEIWRGMPEAHRKLIDGALAAYKDFFAGGSIGQIVLTRDFFTRVDDPAGKLTEAVDVAGGVRCLIHGGYIHLPSGSWNARVVLGFSQEAIGYFFQFIAYLGDRLLASTSFQPNTAGIHTADINFSLGESSERGIDLRVLVLSDFAKGQMAFGHVVMTPVALDELDGRVRSRDRFEAVLEL
jgi:hypothetical protein